MKDNQEFKEFDAVMRNVVTVSHEELKAERRNLEKYR